MWQVIYIADCEKKAKQIKEILSREGFLVRERNEDDSSSHYQILVPASEVEEAVFIINRYEV